MHCSSISSKGARVQLHTKQSVAVRAPSRSTCHPRHIVRVLDVDVTEMARVLEVDYAGVTSSIRNAADGLVAASPLSLRPVVTMVETDMTSLFSFHPSLITVAHLSALYYFVLARPNPLFGILDFYLTRPLSDTRKWGTKDFQLRDRLGGGNFGVTYEGILLQKDERVVSRTLSQEQKKRRVVLKKVNLDREGVRSDFLKAGTMARGSAESGKVEAYMCAKLARNPLIKGKVAQYLGTFTAEANESGFTRGQQWLLWKFESDSTLRDACDGFLGTFPECLEEIVLGRNKAIAETQKRDSLIVKTILKRILEGVEKLHAMGIVHRDLKPDNLLITVEGEVKIIDFGAAADMCTGVNFNPEYGMLDPRYSPPEELIMPKGFFRSPGPLAAALLSPFAWIYGRPDLFDSYSVGVLLIQMAIPQLRRSPDIKTFNNDLRLCDYDLERWRRTFSSRYDFSLLDRNNRAGWDLATKLIKRRDKMNRGRLSASEALRHRYFLPEF